MSSTTCALVATNPSAEMKNPEPIPPTYSLSEREPSVYVTSQNPTTRTTDAFA
jgi:hypothetical protein